MSLKSNGQTKIINVANAIVNKVTSLISTHNQDSNAHSDIRQLINQSISSVEVITSKDNLSDGIYMYGDNEQYSLTISATKSTIQKDETTTISALLKKDDVPLSNETIKFKKDNVINFAKTNASGIATYTYAGSGAGQVNFDVSYCNLLQETFVVTDAIFYDDGIITPNTNWDLNSVTRSTEQNGTKFLVTSSSASARASMNPIDSNGTPYDFDGVPMAFEFDLVDYNATGVLQAQFIQQSPTTVNKAFSLRNSSYVGKTLKVLYTGSKLELYVDEVLTGSISDVTFDSGNKIRVGFAFSIASDYIVVKNVKAYLI